MKRIIIALALLPCLAFAQQPLRSSHLQSNPGSIRFQEDTVSKWSYHVDLGMGLTTGFGATTTHMTVAPSFEFKCSEKLALQAKFMAVNGTDMAQFMGAQQSGRDLAPRRPHSNSSLALGGSISAQYQVSDRLWVAGTLWHVGGQALTTGGLGWMGLMPAGIPIDLNATGFTGEAHYEFSKGNSLSLYLSYINDRTGGMLPLMYDAYGYGYGATPFTGFGGMVAPTAFGSPFCY